MKPRFQRVLLITPPVQVELGAIRPNIGLGYLAQALMGNNICYDVLDMQLGYSLDDLKAKVDTFKPDLLGVSLFSNKYKIAYETIDNIRKHFPLLKVVVGGPHVSCFKKKVLEECRAIDFAVILEGEEALLELCMGEDLERIGNLIYRDGSNILLNETREFIDDLDSLPFPTYTGFEIAKYIEEKSLVSSRGCSYKCIYCSVGTVIGRKVRVRSPKNVVDEIEYWYKEGYRQFSFQDDNFTFYKESVVEICDEIEKRGFKDLFLRCAGARADKLDFNLLKRMKDVGFKTIAIGVEAGNDRMLKVLKKGETIDAIDKAIKLSCEMGFDVYLNFLAGSPYETLLDIRDSINLALKYPIFYAEWSNIVPYPNTELYDWLCREGYLLKRPEEYLNDSSTISKFPIFETPELPYEARVKVLKHLKKVRKRILRRGLIRRFGQTGIPWGFRHCIGYLVSLDILSKYLFQNFLRRIADRMRFSLYMAKKYEE